MTFKEWFKNEFPNTYKGIDKEKLETFVYQCSESAWNHQQAKIDAIEAKIKYALEFTENVHDENWQRAIDDIEEALK